MVEAIPYRNKLVVVINEIIATKILLQYMIFIAMTYFVAKTYYIEFIVTFKTYYHRVYCNGLQRLTFVTIKVYCNKMKVIATKNFIAINLFSCSESSTRNFGRKRVITFGLDKTMCKKSGREV